MGKIYNHLYKKVDYPMEGGYRMEAFKLPNWINVEISQEGDTKTVIVNSRIHQNKRVKMNPQYSSSFSDNEILKDISGKIAYSFL